LENKEPDKEKLCDAFLQNLFDKKKIKIYFYLESQKVDKLNKKKMIF
jgi:hypothetical protein